MIISPKNETVKSLRWYFVVIGALSLAYAITAGFTVAPSLQNIPDTTGATLISSAILISGIGFIFFGIKLTTFLKPAKLVWLKAWIILSSIAQIIFNIHDVGVDYIGIVFSLLVMLYLYKSVTNLSK